MKLTLSLLSLLLSLTTYAQTLRGKVVDEQNAPVAFANVLLLDTDSAFIVGDVTHEDGSFQIAVTEQAALLKISYIGYQDQLFPISEKSDMGIIRLVEETELLDEVVVKGNLPVIRLKGEAIVTNIENTILSDVGSANDVLGKLPGVIRKKDNFEVFGKGTPLIYINGKKVRDNQELEQLNSSEIKHIEMITNPGARYDATIKSVIRIQTLRRKGEGLGVNLRSSYYQSQNTDLINQVNINYRHNNLDIFGSGYYSRMDNYFHNEMQQQNTTNEIWTINNIINENSLKKHLKATLGFNYQINENHTLGMQYDLKTYPTSQSKDISESNVWQNGEYYDEVSSMNENSRAEHFIHSSNAYYNGKVHNLEIDFNTDFYKESYIGNSYIYEESKDQDNREIKSKNPVDNFLAASKLTFSLPIGKSSMSWGAEYIYTIREDNYISEATEFVPTTYSKIREHNLAAFAEYSHIFPFGQLMAGIRYEHNDFSYDENHVHKADQSRKYDNIFPNISFSTKIGNVAIQASYNYKTKRPYYSQLSNNINYMNRFTLKQGEASLRPALIHDFSLNGRWRFLQAMISFKQQKNTPLTLADLVEGKPEMVIIKPVCFNKVPSLSAIVSASPTISIWSPSFSVGVQKQWLEITHNGNTNTFNKPVLMASFNQFLELPWGLRFGSEMSFQGKGNYQNSYVNRNVFVCNVSLRKSFLNNALSVELRGDDISHGQKTSMIANLNYLLGNEKTYTDSREFSITVRYKFNSAPSKYKGTGAGTEQRNRF